MDITNIGKNLKRLREERGISILDVSVETWYSESHIAQIERGKRKPGMDCLLKFMNYYGCDANAIFGMTDEDDDVDDRTGSIDSRIKSLPLKDRERADRIIRSVLDAFDNKGGGLT